jgi:hypothetical protein
MMEGKDDGKKRETRGQRIRAGNRANVLTDIAEHLPHVAACTPCRQDESHYCRMRAGMLTLLVSTCADTESYTPTPRSPKPASF